MDTMQQQVEQNIKYLQLLAREYPSIPAVSTEIINLQAILDLPKGTEHFMSDLHGAFDAFNHIIQNASGVIKEKVDILYENTVSTLERQELATVIYYPERKLEEIKQTGRDMRDFYRITLRRLVDICRLVASKYTRSKVRKALPPDFEYIINELLNSNNDRENKEQYYARIISTIIDIDRADAFIIAISQVIKRLAVDRLHIIGDIFDRGDAADQIMDALLRHHCVDIQWGNHDILWMGAAAGNLASVANVLNNSLQYNNLDTIEDGYGINLRPLAIFANETYRYSPCFAPRIYDDADHDKRDIELVSKIHKAIVIMQFKLEGEIIRRNPQFEMEDRLLLSAIDYEKGTVTIGGKQYPLRDTDFPTIDPADPYRLSPEEEALMRQLCRSFEQSERLQKHVRFLYAKGGLYRCHNSNLLFHGCVPLNEDGSLATIEIGGKRLAGRAMMDYAEVLARQGYFAPRGSAERQRGLDFLWYLWCGKNSPLFGRGRMTTFERYLVADQTTWEEPKNPYYRHNEEEAVCRMILKEFGLDPERSHIINGHVPVKAKDGECPIKAGGKLVVIDGGLSRPYQRTTGIAGYTLIYNSYGMRLISHEPFESVQRAIEENLDIHSTSAIFERLPERMKVADIDDGRQIKATIRDLELLLSAYHLGVITETAVKR